MIEVIITEDIAKKSIKASPTCCPIANFLRQRYTNPVVSTSYCYLNHTTSSRIKDGILLSKEAIDFIAKFDRSKSLDEFTFPVIFPLEAKQWPPIK